jgi:hypothetical protein
METDLKLRQWSYFRQFQLKRSLDPLSLLRHLCGVYSWHPSAALSLRARLKSFSAEDFNELNQSHWILRVPCMRLSVHMVAAEYAPALMAATVPSDPAYWEKRYTQKGREIPSASYESIKEAVLAAADKASLPAEIAKKAGVKEEIIKFVLNRMAYEGFIVRLGADSLRSNKISYISAKVACGRFLGGEDEKKSLRWLAEKYLGAFGPARIKDFQWWAGINVSKAREAVQAINTEMIVLGKEEYFIPAKLAADYKIFEYSFNSELDLLPQWDAYTMGYAPDGRARFVDPKFQPQIYGAIGATGGNGLGTVLYEGEAIAAWDQKITGTKMKVTLSPFNKLPVALTKKLGSEFEKLAEFEGVNKMEFMLKP